MTRSTSHEKEVSVREHHSTIRSRLYKMCVFLKKLGTCSLPPIQKPLYPELPYPDSIRLLRIHAGNGSQPIRCNLQIAGLDTDLPCYEALSYVWRLRQGEKRIKCNNHWKPIPTNLFDALERIRNPCESRLIWVDNLCIDQENSAEKGHQVRQMHQIYRRASRVIVWLGTDEYNEAHSAFATLCTLVNAHNGKTEPVAFSTIRKEHLYCISCIHSPPPLESKEWLTVMAFFTNDWFLRMWVLQEIVLAQSAVFTWGQAELDWSIIGDAIDIIRTQHYLRNLLECRAFQNAYIMHHLGKLQTSKRKFKLPFLHLLDLSRSFDVTYPKDKIYGLLGFPTMDASVEGTQGPFTPPDYDRSVAEIYTNVAKTVALKDQNLDVLSFTSHTTLDFHDRLDMPSWVPNWSSKDIVYPFMAFETHNQHKAGKQKKLDPCSTDNPGILLLKGVVVGVIANSLPSLPFTDLYKSTANLQHLVEWCMQSANVTASAISTTLTGGRDTDGTLLTTTTRDQQQKHLADFLSFIHDLDPNCLQRAWQNDAQEFSELATRIGNPSRAREELWRWSCYRSPFVTEDGRLGLGPGAVKKGDVVVVLWGGQVPYVLREVEGEEWFRFVGECYVDGVMDGEVEGGCEERGFELR